MHDQGGVSYLPWRNAAFVFTQIAPFFDSPVYSHHILSGLITSSGGLTESTLKASANSLFTYMSQMKGDVEKLRGFIGKLTKIFEGNLKDDRVTVPLMKTIETLLSSDYLGDVRLAKDFCSLHSLCVKECNKSKNIVKLMASIGVFSNMLLIQDEELGQKALYTSLLTMEDFSMVVPGGDEDLYDQIIETLSETEWTGQLKQL